MILHWEPMNQLYLFWLLKTVTMVNEKTADNPS